MIRFLPYVLKTLWGHRLRTTLTIVGTAAAIFVLGGIVEARGCERFHLLSEALEPGVVRHPAGDDPAQPRPAPQAPSGCDRPWRG